MRNGTLTILAKVKPTWRSALRNLLDTLEREAFPIFPAVPGLHFARLALIDCAPRGSRMKESYLLLAADFVADRKQRELDPGFIDDLLDRLGQGAAARSFERVFQHCEDFPGLARREAARTFLLARRNRYSARHVAFPYRWQTPESVHEAVRARESLERVLDERSGESPAPGKVRALVSAGGGSLDLRPHLISARRQAAVATLSPSNAFLTWKAHHQKRAYERLRDEGPPIPGARWKEPPPRFARRRIAPDEQVQNPLTQVVPLKHGWAGTMMLRFRLFLVNIRLRRYLVGLNHLQGIHFARWVVFKAAGGYHLLFLSCFDGTWDGYIGAFFDDLPVRALLAEMWTGADRFAEARTLDAFKSWILARQVPTSVFYSAHRAQQLGIADIHQALRVREMLEGTAPEKALAKYMRSGTCCPEAPQMSILAAVTEIARAFQSWLKKERRHASVATVERPAVHRGARRHPAPHHPRVPARGGLPLSADRAGMGREREVLAEN